MKLLGKRTNKAKATDKVVPTDMPKTGIVTSVGLEESRKHHIHMPKITFKRPTISKRMLRQAIIFVGFLGIAAALVGVVFLIKRHQTQVSVAKANDESTLVNKAIQANDTKQALAHAKQAMAYDPNNVDTILVVASLTEKDNPKEAKKLYGRALEAFKKQDNPDVSGKNSTTYWVAAGLAEKAGLTDQAKKYYQKVIDIADLRDVSEQDLVAQSERAIKRLK